MGATLRRHRLRIALALAVALLMGAGCSQSYLGRVQLRDSQVAGCYRAVADRTDDVSRDADIGRLAQVAGVAVSAGPRSAQAAARRRVRCEAEYPSPSLWPWKG